MGEKWIGKLKNGAARVSMHFKQTSKTRSRISHQSHIQLKYENMGIERERERHYQLLNAKAADSYPQPRAPVRKDKQSGWSTIWHERRLDFCIVTLVSNLRIKANSWSDHSYTPNYPSDSWKLLFSPCRLQEKKRVQPAACAGSLGSKDGNGMKTDWLTAPLRVKQMAKSTNS